MNIPHKDVIYSFRVARQIKALVGLSLSVLLVSACTTVNVAKVEANKYPMGLVCIKENPKVVVQDFLSVVEAGFQRHGIETEVYETATPPTCEYVLSYSATRGWDLVPFLKDAELHLKQGNKVIGSATYHNKGGFTVTKYAGTESKMNPVIDELLAGFASR